MTTAKNYALALWDIWQPEKLNRVNYHIDVLQILERLYRKSRDFRTLLDTPTLSQRQKEDRLSHAFREVDSVKVMKLLFLLIEKKEMRLLERIIHELKLLRNTGFSYLPLEVTTLRSLQQDEIDTIEVSLKEIFHVEHVSIKQKLSEKILGGMVFEFEGHKLDTSLKAKLHKIETKLLP